MKNTIVGEHIARSNRSWLLTSLTLLGVVSYSFYALRTHFYYQLFISYSNTMWYDWIVFALLVLLFLFALYQLIKAVNYSRNYLKHPIAQSLSKYGDSLPLIIQKIDEDFSNNEVKKFGHLFISKSWAIKKHGYGALVIFILDIVWVYKKVVKKSVNFVPTGRDYSAIIKTLRGESMEVEMEEEDVNEMIRVIVDRLPYLVVGYTDQIDSMWQRSPMEFGEAVISQKKNNFS